MTTESQKIEAQIQEAKEMAELGASLDRLMSNRDFKKVFLQGYFKDEAVKLVQTKAHPEMQNPHSQSMILKDIDGIGSLQMFLNDIKSQADKAKIVIDDGQKELAEIHQEGGE